MKRKKLEVTNLPLLTSYGHTSDLIVLISLVMESIIDLQQGKRKDMGTETSIQRSYVFCFNRGKLSKMTENQLLRAFNPNIRSLF